MNKICNNCKMKNIECEFCNKKFIEDDVFIEVGIKHFCDNECMNEFYFEDNKLLDCELEDEENEIDEEEY